MLRSLRFVRKFLNRFRNFKIADLPQKCKGFFSFFGALHEVWLFCPVNLRKFSAFASLTVPKLSFSRESFVRKIKK